MNNRGFTLIEVLVVIIILSGLLIITISGLLNPINSSKETISKSKINTLLILGNKYAEDNINDYGQCLSTKGPKFLETNCKIDLDILIDNGYIENDSDILIDPFTNERYQITLLVCYDINKKAPYIKYYTDADLYSCE